MKFAKQLETEAEDIPKEWRPYLIRYKALKKIITKVTEEIERRGLSASLLQDCSYDNNLKYYFTGKPPHVKPNIEIIYDSENPRIQDILSRLEYKRSFDNKDVFSFTESNQSQVVSVVKELLHKPLDHPKTIVIELEQDDEFFNLLIQELEDATEMQDKTAQRFQKDIGVLESNLTQVTSPGSDMYVWRKIFSIYMDACIFSGTVEVSRRQMQWFLTQCKGVVKKSSKRAFEQFVALNTELITIQHYQLLNQTAMRKILKNMINRVVYQLVRYFSRWV
ncbi:unnamed protein product [Rhizopus stolonifer]